MKCSIGIFAYNEERNIGKILDAILNQNLNQAELEEIFVVASGCTDKTVNIAKEFEQRDRRIKIILQKKREGKYSAINLFLKSSKNDMLIIESADTVPDNNAIENLIMPFADPAVGMTGARPVPADSQNNFMGYCVNLLWDIHHQISLISPKMGEMVAFRKVFDEIPKTAVDEACIEALIKSKGYNIVYVPEAIVRNKGSEILTDFLRQRRRIHAGHLQLKTETGHDVSTTGTARLFSCLLKTKVGKDLPAWKRYAYMLGAIFIEGLARILGAYDYKIIRKDHSIWAVSESTKKI